MDLALPVPVGLPRTNLVKPQFSVGTGPVPFQAFAAPAPSAVGESAIGESTVREQLSNMGGDVDLAQPPPPARAPYPSAISTQELLERAAALRPARTTWESIVLPADPILDEKQLPHVAERRERFTRMVKVGLGACLAVCVVALGVSALSGDASAATPASAAEARNTVPAQGIVPVEKLGSTACYAKAARLPRPSLATAAVVRAKRR